MKIKPNGYSEEETQLPQINGNRNSFTSRQTDKRRGLRALPRRLVMAIVLNAFCTLFFNIFLLQLRYLFNENLFMEILF